jgi:hypothetical protein
MTSHDVEHAAAETEASRLASIVLVRVATGGGTEAEVARDLQALVPGRTVPEIWRIELGRLLAALSAGGLIVRQGSQLAATESGHAAAAEFLGLPKGLPSSWAATRDRALMARALGIAAPSARQLRLLATPDGLRALIVIRHFGLALRGAVSPSRVRTALAVKALERGFGPAGGEELGDKSSKPSKTARQLAGRLSATPRDFGTDARLIAALAAEAVGARRPDHRSLELALLQQFLGGADEAPHEPSRARLGRMSRRHARRSRGSPDARLGPVAALYAERSMAPEAGPMPTGHATRPDPHGFAGAVNAAADAVAEGWPGNRKAFISRVWSEVATRHPQWSLSEIEFKCMLAEAHRTGLVALANADLKDKSMLKELQDSATVYKNTVWHYVRVQD